MSGANFCSWCGAQVATGASFCSRCGKPLPGTGAALTAAATPYPGYPAPSSMVSFSTILSRMFDTWKENFGTFFIVYLVLGLVTGGVSAALSFSLFGVVATGGFSGTPALSGIGTSVTGLYALYILVVLVATVVIQTIVVGGMTEYAVRRGRNEKMILRQAIDRGVSKFFSIFGATLLVVLMVVGILLVPLLLLFAGALGGAGLGLLGVVLVGLVIAFVVIVYLALGLFLFAPAIMMENRTALDSLRRSWELTKGHRLSIFGAIIVAGILTIIIDAVITIPASLTGIPAVSVVATAVSGGIVGSWVVILSAMTYSLILGLQGPGTVPASNFQVGR